MISLQVPSSVRTVYALMRHSLPALVPTQGCTEGSDRGGLGSAVEVHDTQLTGAPATSDSVPGSSRFGTCPGHRLRGRRLYASNARAEPAVMLQGQHAGSNKQQDHPGRCREILVLFWDLQTVRPQGGHELA
ncbi:hypothetical protein AVEN_58047-1 [Araneus ventricosus]|uniref:Uncharacterized protein n=1 Tax=Araneus ventricosus TaxID=182803 RepID=A0A4Y2P5S5_ARAVE|nr:hypothetical protein AVEN_58047-1 [Araneus ventricosus]